MTKPWGAACVLFLLASVLAGCGAPESRRVDGTLAFVVDQVHPTTMDAVELAGTTSHLAQLTILAEREGDTFFDTTLSIEGAWRVKLTGLAYGHSNVRLFADSGSSVARANLTVVRLAHMTLEVVYSAYPPHSDSRDDVLVDIDGFASAWAYQDRDVAHPPHATVHDLMVTWTNATGIVADYVYGQGFGYAATHFDGVGQPLSAAAPPYWCYKVNGQYANLGLSLQEVKPGDVVAWDYGTCA